MELETIPVVILVGAIVLLYGAIRNKNPIDVIKLALSGKSLDGAKPMMTGGGATQTVPGTPHPDPTEFHSNGKPRAYPNGQPLYADDPWPIPPTDPRSKFKVIPPAGAAGDPRAPKDANRPRGIAYAIPFMPGNIQ